ncbi:hypothetical protein KAI87_00840 [Myxococcota bacterium]|nr:hypothetical protein [Myxococcota bacterium]
MSRKVQIVILCEDSQQEVFIRRFLAKQGWPTRRLRIEKSPAGSGSAEDYVRKRFPFELKSYRSKLGQVNQALIVMMDGDNKGVKLRLRELDESCRTQTPPIEVRRDNERVAIFIPTWRIESWFAYLDGQDVNEAERYYPKLAHERDCQRHVTALVEMSKRGELRKPTPLSLEQARIEYNKRLVQK